MESDPTVAFEFAAETAKQLITLSTGIVALTLTYASGPGKSGSKAARRLLIASWVLFLLSTLFGVGTLMAMTGSLAQGQLDIYSGSIPTYSGLQVLTFVSGLGVAVIYGVAAIRRPVDESEGGDDGSGNRADEPGDDDAEA